MSGDFQLWRRFHISADLADRIENLRPVLEEAEKTAIADRRFPQAGVDALVDAGLFKLALPREVGGDESHPVAEFEAYEALARISVTAAWIVLVGNIHTAWTAAYLADDAVAEIFPAGHRTIVAGQAAPLGKAEEVAGGYRVSGRYSWGSGISHANWVLAGFRCPASGESRAFVVPKSAVSVLDNWHVFGVEGSGSYDYQLEDVFVPEGFTFAFPAPVQRRGGPRYGLSIFAQAALPHSAVALGGAEHALEAIAALAGSKRRSMQQSTLADRGAFQHHLGEAYIDLSAARAHAATAFADMHDRAHQGPPLVQPEISRLVAIAARSCRIAAEVANTAYRYGGGNSLRLDSPLQRALRDVLVAQQHYAATDTAYEEVGLGILERFAPVQTAAAA